MFPKYQKVTKTSRKPSFVSNFNISVFARSLNFFGKMARVYTS